MTSRAWPQSYSQLADRNQNVYNGNFKDCFNADNRKVSEYGQEMPQPHTIDQPTTLSFFPILVLKEAYFSIPVNQCGQLVLPERRNLSQLVDKKCQKFIQCHRFKEPDIFIESVSSLMVIADFGALNKISHETFSVDWQVAD